MSDAWERLSADMAVFRERGEFIRRRDAGKPRLKCVECGEWEVEDLARVRTYLTVDDQPATYCPDCAEREFGYGA